MRDAGLRVSSLCRGGFFTPRRPGRARAIDDNRRGIEEAAALGTDVLVLVCGGLPPGSRDLQAAREMVHDGIAAVIADAEACGVRLAIEPLHPMMVAERSVISTLREANDLASRFDAASVGVIVDSTTCAGMPYVEGQIARAAGRILGFHVRTGSRR